MKPFNLDPVLNYRERIEDVARQRLQQAMEQEEKAQTLHDRLREALAVNYSALDQLRQEGTRVEKLLLFEQHNELLRDELTKAAQALHESRALVARRRQDLLKASQEKKVLEKLKQHQNLLYRRHLERLERRQMDEIAVLRHQRTT